MYKDLLDWVDMGYGCRAVWQMQSEALVWRWPRTLSICAICCCKKVFSNCRTLDIFLTLGQSNSTENEDVALCTQ